MGPSGRAGRDDRSRSARPGETGGGGRDAFTLTEALISLVLALVLLGLLFLIFVPSERQGRSVSQGLQAVHGVTVLTAQLESDLQRADDVKAAGNELVLEWGTSHELDATDYAARQRVRYGHEPGGPVTRSLQTLPRGAAPGPTRTGTVGHERYRTVTFQAGTAPGSVEVTLDRGRRPGETRDPEPVRIKLEAALVRRGDYWTPNRLP